MSFKAGGEEDRVTDGAKQREIEGLPYGQHQRGAAAQQPASHADRVPRLLRAVIAEQYGLLRRHASHGICTRRAVRRAYAALARNGVVDRIRAYADREQAIAAGA